MKTVTLYLYEKVQHFIISVGSVEFIMAIIKTKQMEKEENTLADKFKRRLQKSIILFGAINVTTKHHARTRERNVSPVTFVIKFHELHPGKFIHWLRNSHIYGTAHMKDHNTLPVVRWNHFTELFLNLFEHYFTLLKPLYYF